MQHTVTQLLLIRHGVTHMNEYLATTPYGSRGFADPGLFDTRLTEEGERQATSLRATIADEHSREPIELLIASPLTRALATADLAFGDVRPRCLVDPDLAERRYLSSDVGRPPADVAAEYPRFADALRALEASWWWEGDHQAAEAALQSRLALQDSDELKGFALPVEPNQHFLRRVDRFRERLLALPEKRVAVVAHWGVLYALLGGRSLKNCELVVTTSDALPAALTPTPD